MSDLISRSALLKEIAEEYDLNYGEILINPKRFYEMVETVPTAYSVEKVVAELEEAKEKIAREDYCRTQHYIENDCEHKDCFKCCAEYLIDIVRKGGVE